MCCSVIQGGYRCVFAFGLQSVRLEVRRIETLGPVGQMDCNLRSRGTSVGVGTKEIMKMIVVDSIGDRSTRA